MFKPKYKFQENEGNTKKIEGYFSANMSISIFPFQNKKIKRKIEVKFINIIYFTKYLFWLCQSIFLKRILVIG